MNNKLITYLTTTYNRRDQLKNLYMSLKKQTCSNFNWMIIDDGSTDLTYDFINVIKKEADFKIFYYKKTNGGKHRAINYAIPKLDSTLVMIIDSDDRLLPECSAIIKEYWKKYQSSISRNNIGSFIFERGRSGISDPMEKINGEFIASRFLYVEKYRKFGDYNDVFVVKYLQKFKLPEFKGEKFISENPLYYSFSMEYKSVFISKVIAVGDYRSDGLTSHIRQLKVDNYKGALYELRQAMNNSPALYSSIKHNLLYDYVAIASKASVVRSVSESKSIFLSLLLLGPAGFFVILDKKNKVLK